MPQPVAELVAIALLLGLLGFAVVRPRGLPEAVAAVPAAGLLVAMGVVPAERALHEVTQLGPTVGFLAAVLVLGHLCAEEGVFRAAGALMAGTSRGRPTRLLGLVFALAAAVTAVLSLDATVVLLTPVVFATATSLRLRAKPHVYACTHLANSASLLLPVSNLTNLLAFGATGLSFGRFAVLMALPWLVVIGTEYTAFRRFFATDLAVGQQAAVERRTEVPAFALVVVALTLAGFGVSSFTGIQPVWVAVAGALVLAVRRVALRHTSVGAVVSAGSIPFLLFVPALGVVVVGVEAHGLGALVCLLLPGTPSFHGLLVVAVLAAVLANLLNNLPAILVLLPTLSAHHHPGLVLAALVGVDVGPNLTYVGSLATLLWRRVLRTHDAEPALVEFLRLGGSTVPVALVLGVTALWGGLLITGGG